MLRGSKNRQRGRTARVLVGLGLTLLPLLLLLLLVANALLLSAIEPASGKNRISRIHQSLGRLRMRGENDVSNTLHLHRRVLGRLVDRAGQRRRLPGHPPRRGCLTAPERTEQPARYSVGFSHRNGSLDAREW